MFGGLVYLEKFDSTFRIRRYDVVVFNGEGGFLRYVEKF